MLAVCSKNDPDIASHAVDEHPEMILRRKDFACFAANWPRLGITRRPSMISRKTPYLAVFMPPSPPESAHFFAQNENAYGHARGLLVLEVEA